MSQAQRIILTLGFVGIRFLCLCPPYQWERTTYTISPAGAAHRAEMTTENAGHHWIWDTPAGSTKESDDSEYLTRTSSNVRLDLTRLGIYVGLATAFTLFAAFVALRKRDGDRKIPEG